MTRAPAQTDLPSHASPDAPEATTPATTKPQHTMGPTRTSMVWTMVGIGAVLLLATLVFILQDGTPAHVRFLMLDGTLPLGVGLMFAVLLVLTAGAARVLQPRPMARRHRRSPTSSPEPSRPLHRDPCTAIPGSTSGLTPGRAGHVTVGTSTTTN